MPPAGVPSDTFLEERRRTFHNGDAIEMFWEPNAVTDGDSLVHFRRADVIVTGDIFTTTQFPFIDVSTGGSVEGEIRAFNESDDAAVAAALHADRRFAPRLFCGQGSCQAIATSSKEGELHDIW